MFYQKLCQEKFVDLIEIDNFAFLRFFYISHIIVKNLNFRSSIVFFLIQKKNTHLLKKIAIHICRSSCSKQFCIITFFSYLV